MEDFLVQGDTTFCEGLPLEQLARQYGTPLFVYSRQALVRQFTRLRAAFASYPTLACFAVKSNSNIAILAEAGRHGYGADVVSVGELERALAAGIPADRIVFSGVGKRPDEIHRGLQAGILSFNVESLFELDTIAHLATEAGQTARICLRINPNISAETHAHITTGLHDTKFGVPEADLPAALDRIRATTSLTLIGISCHIGSQITKLEPLRQAAQTMRAFAERIRAQGFAIELLDLGGGLGIRYADETPPDFRDYAAALIEAMAGSGLRLVLEPGRVLVGNAGVLVTQVLGIKKTPAKTFVVVDAAMNDLARPALYGAFHGVAPVRSPASSSESVVDIVGPICESTDTLARNRSIALPAAGDFLFFKSCGAYGSSMGSTYNSRPRPPEVLVDGKQSHVIRERESLQDIWRHERIAQLG